MLIFIINLRSSKNRKDLMTKKIENLAKKSHYRVFLESKLLNGQNFGEDLCGQVGAKVGVSGEMAESKVAHLESSVNAILLESNPSKSQCFQNDASNPSPRSLESNDTDVHLESSAFGTQMLEVENTISSLESSDNFEGLESEPSDLSHSEKGLKYDNFEKLESKPSDLSSGGEVLKRNNLKGLESESNDLSSGGLVGVVDLESGDIDLPFAFTNQNAESKIPDSPLESCPNSPLESKAIHSPFESNAHNSFSGVTGKHLNVDSPIESPHNLSLDSNAAHSPLESLCDSPVDLPLESKAQDSLPESHHDLPLESKTSAFCSQSKLTCKYSSKIPDSPLESCPNSPESSHDLESHHNPNLPLESRPDSPQDSPPTRVLDPKAKPNEAFYFHFFDAICAESQECKKEPLKHYSPFLTKLVRGRELSANEVYCFASHFSLWQKCIDLGRDIIVLEDDVSFCDNFLESILEIKDSRFEYVRLRHTFEKKCHHLNGNFYVSYANLLGAQGYFLSCRGAGKFIKHAKTWFHCVDNYMDMFFINDVANIVYKPFCIREDDEVSHDSTIQTKEKTKMGRGRKVLREIARIALFSVYKNLYLLYQMCKGKARLSGKK